MEGPDVRQQKLGNQRTLLMKKQQQKRADAQMVVVNRDSRRKHKVVRSDEAPLLISKCLSNISLADQVEHAHDNPLDEIMLGECDIVSDNMSSEKPVPPKTIDLEVDKAPEEKCDAENGSHAKGKKSKKKDVKKEKAKEVAENEEKDVEKVEKKEKKTKMKTKDKVKESEDTQKTNKMTKPERKKKHLQEEAGAAETEAATLNKNTCEESDKTEEETTQTPELQSAREGKKTTGKRSNRAEKPPSSPAPLKLAYRRSSSSDSNSNHRPMSPTSVEDLGRFASCPASRDVTIQCRVTRDRRGMEKGIYPTYYLHMEKENGKRKKCFHCATAKVFLMAGRKRKKSKTSNYLISIDPTNLSRDTNCYIGKLRSNVLGTKFTVYDGGENPEKKPFIKESESVRQELAAICYDTNLLGFNGPRKMTVIIPGMLENDERVSICPKNDLETLLACHASGSTDKLVTLVNKSPVWNEQTQSYVLNFHGRVTLASVKNFQIIHPDNEEHIVMQFGRVAEDVFSMDYTFPLCALQAFAITLSSFDNKLACE